jgi:hypothetical protein
MNLSRRLVQLEQVLAEKVAARKALNERAREERAKLDAAWACMYATMDPEHARLVVEAYEAGYQYVTSPSWGSPASRLLSRCLDALRRQQRWPYDEIPPEVAFAMPPVVAEVYLARDVLPLHECEDCGYKLPFGFFEVCPLCGGRIGYYAYWHRRTRERDGK